MKDIAVWIGDFGSYHLPDELKDVPITKSGWPDMRFKRALDLLAWVEQEEDKAKKGIA